MRKLAILLSLCLPLAAAAQVPATPAEVAISTGAPPAFSTITVTAPHLRAAPPAGEAALKTVRAGGVAAAAGGLGLIAYAVIFEAAGPIGWAAGLLFFGGMTAYIAHRRLHGHDDLQPDDARVNAAATSRQ
ncbi:MAG TPA: hypothetical protein VH309_13280 [Elusimicrobiota bacterium]|nr:hypothetical protein [Elusimicrobiota bacterium]